MAKHYIRGNYIWVQGSIEGIFHRYSTKRSKDNEEYLRYISKKKNVQKVLLQLHCQPIKQVSSNFKKFALEMVENKKDIITESSYRDIKSRLHRFLIPTFKNYSLHQITRSDIQRWLVVMRKSTSQDLTRRTFILFNEILNEAYLNDLIEKNPCQQIKKLKRKAPRKREPYTIEEVEKILSNATGWLKTYLILSFFTGLRSSDILNLKWENIDLNKKIIKTNISKTDDYLEIDMIQVIFDALSEYIFTKHNSLLFPNYRGVAFTRPESINAYHFKPLLKKLNIEYKDLYTTRHTFASIMINGGADVAWVSKMMSHANIQTTLKHYNSYIETRVNRVEVANNIIKQNLQINIEKKVK